MIQKDNFVFILEKCKAASDYMDELYDAGIEIKDDKNAMMDLISAIVDCLDDCFNVGGWENFYEVGFYMFEYEDEHKKDPKREFCTYPDGTVCILNSYGDLYDYLCKDYPKGRDLQLGDLKKLLSLARELYEYVSSLEKVSVYLDSTGNPVDSFLEAVIEFLDAELDPTCVEELGSGAVHCFFWEYNSGESIEDRFITYDNDEDALNVKTTEDLYNYLYRKYN